MLESMKDENNSGGICIPNSERNSETFRPEFGARAISEVGYGYEQSLKFWRNNQARGRLSAAFRSQTDGRRPFMFTEGQSLVAMTLRVLGETGIAGAPLDAAAEALNHWGDTLPVTDGTPIRNPAEGVLIRYQHGIRGHQLELKSLRSSVTGELAHVGRVTHPASGTGTNFKTLPADFQPRSITVVDLDRLLDHITREMPVN